MTFKASKSVLRRAALTGASAVAMLTAATSLYALDVTGTVKTKNSATALEGAIIKIEELNRRAVAGSDGTFRFNNVPAGEYTVIVSYIGAEPMMRKVTVLEGDNRLEFTVPGAVDDLEEIFVVGQRGSLNSSISKQRAADNVASFLSADAAGNFPDQNVTEAVRRLVGVSVENDQGEGRYITIRGLDPNLNSSSVGGIRLPSPEGDDRKVALDVIPSELLETVEVTKSLTPDMDGDAIGGNVDIKTLSGFDKEGLFIKGKVEGSYNRQQDDVSPKVGLTLAGQLSDKLAIAGSVSYYDRSFGTDNVEIDGGWINEDDDDNEIDALVPAELELRDYVVQRRRIGAALNIDFRPSENTDLYLRTLYSDFKDEELRTRMEHKFEDGAFDLDNLDSLNSNQIFFEGIKADRDMKDRIETQKIYTVSAGGETRFDDFTASYSVSYSHAEEAEPDRVDTDFKGKGFNAGVDFSDPFLPQTIFRTQDDYAAITDLGEYDIDAIEYSDNITEDDQIAFKFDLAYDTYWNDNPLQLKWGAKVRLREKTRDNTFVVYEDLGDYTLADFATSIDYPLDFALGNVGPDNGTLRDFFAANRSSFEINEADSLIGSEAVDYEAKEDIYATYMMGRLDIGSLRIVGGLRYEYTDFSTLSNFVQVGEEVLTDGNGAPILDGEGDPETEDVSVVLPVAADRDYDYFLPSINFRWEANENIVARLAYFRSVVRPNIGDVVPSGEIEFEEEIEDGEIVRTTEGEIGNPALVPMWAHNIDASLEWYPSNNAVLSVGVFYKDIHNFVVDRTVEDVTIQGVHFDEVVRPYNGDTAEVKGFEVNYQQSLTFLPGILDGLIIGANYTYVDTEAEIFDGEDLRVIPLPKSSKNIANLVLGYEKGPLSLRAAMTYRDEYLDELNSSDGDRYVLSHTQWDFSASYDVTDNIKVYGEVSNAGDEPFRAVYRTEDGDFLMQHEQYDWTANMGVKVKF